MLQQLFFFSALNISYSKQYCQGVTFDSIYIATYFYINISRLKIILSEKRSLINIQIIKFTNYRRSQVRYLPKLITKYQKVLTRYF